MARVVLDPTLGASRTTTAISWGYPGPMKRLFPLTLALTAGCACGNDDVCRVDGGRYFAIEPQDWDGRSKLPVILTAHGYGGSPDVILKRSDIGGPYSKAGVLWLVPEGDDNSWATRNSPESSRSPRDDVAFLGKVLDDVADQWPIDRTRIAASGFSQGGSMASELACLDPQRWSVVMPVSGTFWHPEPTDCEGAVSVRHTHGTTDSTWPLSGRSFGSWTQGNVDEGLAAFRATAQCGESSVQVDEDGVTCAVFDDCAGGHEVRLCLHDGAHSFPIDEAPRQVDWLGALGWW